MKSACCGRDIKRMNDSLHFAKLCHNLSQMVKCLEKLMIRDCYALKHFFMNKFDTLIYQPTRLAQPSVECECIGE